MKKHWLYPYAFAACIAAAFYVLVCGVMYVKQRDLMYFPVKYDAGTPAENHVPEMKVIHATTSDGLDLMAWFAPPKGKEGKIVVLYHGNGGNLDFRAMKARYFLDAGYGVYLCEYRGFYPNKGKPSEQGLYMDARAALEWLKKQGYKNSQFVIYGESIGTGVAVQIATEYQPRELILEAAFTSTVDVAKTRFRFLPVDLLMTDRFESIDKIKQVHTNLLSIHGDSDGTIALHFGKELYEAANAPKAFMLVPHAGHNDIYSFNTGPKIVGWLDKAVAAEK